jgi:hypothetical protein
MRLNAVGSKNSSGPPVILQQTAKSLAALNGALPAVNSVFRRREQDGVVLSLVISFSVI